MTPLLKLCKVVKKTTLRENLFDIVIKDEEMASLCVAGQFLHIKCGEKSLLRRPISICDVVGDEIRFIFEIRGEGTKELSNIKVGEDLDIIGPIGKGFTVENTKEKAVFVGGGIGIFPLLMAAKKFKENATILLGFRNKEAVVLEEDFKGYDCNVIIATDDGSYGVKGFVTDLLKDCEMSAIYACGPLPMIKKTVHFAKEQNIFCEVSMEERMGCGVGACLVCACKAVKGYGFTYKHVCKDGPVFNANEVIFDD